MDLLPAETELVVNAATEAVNADTKCSQRITERIDAWKAEGKSPIETYPENKTLIIACRQIQLDLADRLLEKLSVESRPKLLAFANDRRKGIVSFVPEAELEFYRRPR